MKLYKELKALKSIPFDHAKLLSILREYKNANEKIKNMVKNGEIVRIKRELYVVGELFRDEGVSLEIVANLLYGPSYISLDWALSHYGLIPERVHEVTSITTKIAKSYDTPLGRFSYTKGDKRLYPIGISLIFHPSGASYMIATKEKAICDKIVYSPNLNITSKKAMGEYLIDDLRIELDELATFDVNSVKMCMEAGKKSKLLGLFCGLLQNIKDGAG